MKAVLKYTNGGFSQDARTIIGIISQYNIEILKASENKATIRVKDSKELNELISVLNQNCTYAVRIASVKSEDGLLSKIKRIFE